MAIDSSWVLRALTCFPPVDTYLYTECTKDGDELPGWYKARVEEYYADGSCKIVYREEDEHVVSEVIDLNTVNWKPCCKKARKFVPLQAEPVVSKVRWKPSRKVVNSAEHSVKGYADDVTLISSYFDVHVTVLQTADQRAGDCLSSQ